MIESNNWIKVSHEAPEDIRERQQAHRDDS